MRVEDWFDPNNLEHIEAYRHLTKFGEWPAGFIPDEAVFAPAWFPQIAAKMADCWAKHMLGNDY